MFGVLTISACSTVSPQPSDVDIAQYCPADSVIVASRVYKSTIQIKQGETAFQTVKQFRLAEAEKNAAMRRLLTAYRRCRSVKAASAS